MPGTSKQGDASSSSKPSIAPYEQHYRTVIQHSTNFSDAAFEIVQRKGWDFGTFRWGSISFDVRLDIESSTEFLLKVTCNRGGSDPHWLCEFIVSANAELEPEMVANNDDNVLVMNIGRLPANPAGGHDLDWAIRMTSWSGIFPPLLHSFSTKTDISDATLIVEGKPLYVSRALLALHSTFFNTLFFDDKFPDAAKDEFPLADVSYDDMLLYLQLVSPNISDDTPEEMFHSIDAVESMLALAERFGNDTLTREMEQYLMGTKGAKIEGRTNSRVLLISDRFRLSEPASHIMHQLQCEAARLVLGDTEEYWQLSADVKAAILDSSMRRNRQQTSEPSDPRLSSSTRDPIEDLFFELNDAYASGMRLRRPVPPTRSADSRRYRRRSPAGTSSASSTSTASNLSFEVFTTDLTRLGIAFHDLRRASSLPRQRLDTLERILDYFIGLSSADYLRLPYVRRGLIHDFIRHVGTSDVARADNAIVALNVAVDLARNDLRTGADSSTTSNRTVEGPARKRMRM